eukprot:TRINITY_DN135_c0_g1_i5.p1 TRINITY_DN135_c0_g1~~TRINITY_DN135_c0_g1_i5.p1  ORF type:complete len:120 (+),score=10.58 TRINITY_DN135_c0_g1_i5:111-470(+)
MYTHTTQAIPTPQKSSYTHDIPHSVEIHRFYRTFPNHTINIHPTPDIPTQHLLTHLRYPHCCTPTHPHPTLIHPPTGYQFNTCIISSQSTGIATLHQIYPHNTVNSHTTIQHTAYTHTP